MFVSSHRQARSILARVPVLIALLCHPDLVPAALASPDPPPADSLVLSVHEGRVVYLDFWASWCAPCRKSFPWMVAMHEKYRDSGLVIVAVNVDRVRQAAEKFLDEFSPEFRVIFDGRGELARRYRLEAMPMSYIYGRDGKLREAHPGFLNRDTTRLEETLVELLGEQANHDQF